MKAISVISAILFCLAAKAQPIKVVNQQLVGTYFENLVGISIDEKKEVVLILDSLHQFSLAGIYGFKQISHKGQWTIENDSLVLTCVYSGHPQELVKNSTPILKKYRIMFDVVQKPMLQGWNKERALLMTDLVGEYQTHYHLRGGDTDGKLRLTCEMAPVPAIPYPRLEDMPKSYYGFFVYQPYSTKANPSTITGSWTLQQKNLSQPIEITFTPDNPIWKPLTMELNYREDFLFKTQPSASGRREAAFDRLFSHGFAIKK